MDWPCLRNSQKRIHVGSLLSLLDCGRNRAPGPLTMKAAVPQLPEEQRLWPGYSGKATAHFFIVLQFVTATLYASRSPSDLILPEG